MVEKITYLCATKIYPNSEGLNQIILDQNFTSKRKLKVIANGSSNGIDTSTFDPDYITNEEKRALAERLGIIPADTVFVFVGRIVGDKGIHELITAFKKINDSTKNVKLLLVGTYEKELDPISQDIEEEINTNPNIISVGWQNDVRPYFSISHILTFPSYREGFPNVVMQAASMGLACIVSDINGCNEIVNDKENGLIIPVKNTDALYDSMQLLVSDSEMMKNIASKARESITRRYQREFVWEELLKEYRSLSS